MTTVYLKEVDGKYKCQLDITVGEWILILNNPDVTTRNQLAMLIRFFFEPDHKASCTTISNKHDLTVASVNATITQFGMAVKKHLNRFEIKDDDAPKNERFWCVAMESGEDKEGYFEWTLRSELVEAIRQSHFTWIPFYKELADKLLQYRNNRKPLLDIILSLPNEYISYLKEFDGKPIADIEPFSIYAIFNRNIHVERRNDICAKLKESLGIKSDIPSDFEGIPIVNNLKSFFFNVPTGNGCEELWSLFEAVIKGQNDLTVEFDSARQLHSVKWNLTMFLYWIRPDDFLPLDANTRLYLKDHNIALFKDKDLDWDHYSSLLETVKARYPGIKMSSLSYYAWSATKDGPYETLLADYRKTVAKNSVRAIDYE